MLEDIIHISNLISKYPYKLYESNIETPYILSLLYNKPSTLNDINNIIYNVFKDIRKNKISENLKIIQNIILNNTKININILNKRNLNILKENLDILTIKTIIKLNSLQIVNRKNKFTFYNEKHIIYHQQLYTDYKFNINEINNNLLIIHTKETNDFYKQYLKELKLNNSFIYYNF